MEISQRNWTAHEDEMLSFLGVKRIEDPDASPQFIFGR
jgi:hypothetical protein